LVSILWLVITLNLSLNAIPEFFLSLCVVALPDSVLQDSDLSDSVKCFIAFLNGIMSCFIGFCLIAFSHLEREREREREREIFLRQRAASLLSFHEAYFPASPPCFHFFRHHALYPVCLVGFLWKQEWAVLLLLWPEQS
jgi:hypothetical protein